MPHPDYILTECVPHLPCEKVATTKGEAGGLALGCVEGSGFGVLW